MKQEAGNQLVCGDVTTHAGGVTSVEGPEVWPEEGQTWVTLGIQIFIIKKFFFWMYEGVASCVHLKDKR